MPRYAIICGNYVKYAPSWQSAYAYARALSREWLWFVHVYREQGSQSRVMRVYRSGRVVG